jgi:hypothetical protein
MRGGGRGGHLKGVEEQLVLEFLDHQDLLEHVVQLLLGQDHFAVELLLITSGTLGVVVALEDAVEFGHPRRQHRLLAQTVDLRQ